MSVYLQEEKQSLDSIYKCSSGGGLGVRSQSVLLASTFTGMHSVVERVQGPQPERERAERG